LSRLDQNTDKTLMTSSKTQTMISMYSIVIQQSQGGFVRQSTVNLNV